jgi:hypothetical protein
MACWLTRIGRCLFAATLLLMVASTAAQALPPFAAQTGQPRGACHVGAFGAQPVPAAPDFARPPNAAPVCVPRFQQ